MITYISILRGINVSGKNIIKMDSLRQLYIDMGFKNVQTYIQSGNVIFQTIKSDTSALQEKITKKISDTFNLNVPVVVLELFEFQEIVNNNPFISRENIDITRLYITFLASLPNKENIENTIKLNYSPEEFIILNKAVYLYCPMGYGTTKLSNNFFENKLKVKATTRNLKTCNELIKIAQQF